ncbi:hypothetical protein [Bifidobacterium polysaccharolyticum]|uniref:hypothetical protein n=1 Tax=Bifidobacterium polysaccharolyticum TaxID=2750967 RepID=UPI0021BB074B|nr:hypothetical protein [Bifidobacterium polysaccharolyticum]MCT8158234.1 hypothetical protein [Bifidobacterium polysaccharolyticum]
MSDTNTNTTEDTGTGTATGLQPYVQQEWANGEEGGTPISAERLQHMETGIGDLSKTLLDGRLPSYTVTSKDAPAPCTPCILVVVDQTGLYQGTWSDDGKTRVQVGWRAGGDEEKYRFTPPADAHPTHMDDYATLTRHGSMVQLEGMYSLDPSEKASTSNSLTIYWIKIPRSCLPTYDVYSVGNSADAKNFGVEVAHWSSENVWLVGSRSGVNRLHFNMFWMTDALPPHPSTSSRMLPPSAAQTAESAAMQEPAQQTQAQTAPTQTENTQAAAPAGDATQQAPAVQAPAVQAPASQAMPVQEQAPAVQPDTSQAPAQQEQAAAQAPATQAVQEQAPARTSPAHAAPGQTPAVPAPAVQDAPAPAAGTARHARQGLEE